MVCQGLGETLVKGGVLHIYYHTVDIIKCNLVCQAVGFILWRHGGHGNVSCPVSQQDDQRLHIRVQDTLTQQGLLSHIQPAERGVFPPTGYLPGRVVPA